jgi:hypothetical protein
MVLVGRLDPRGLLALLALLAQTQTQQQSKG